MSIVCIALIGKQNEPLYFYCKEDSSEFIHLQMIAHSALDVIEEKKKKALNSSAAFDMYFGLLFPVDDYRVYGSYSNTHQKMILICDSEGNDNVGIREAVTALGAAFVNASQNPFQEIDSPYVSKKLDSIVQQIVLRQNSLLSKRRP